MVIMIKKRMALLLVGLVFISPLSSFFTVICQGSDGHVAVEATVHNHCDCPDEPSDVENQIKDTRIIGSSSEHGHCDDMSAAENFIVPTRKNSKLSTHNVFIPSPVLKSIPLPSTFIFEHPAARSNECFPFFAPLRTVILLS